MQIKFVLAGESVNIPYTSIGMGVAFVKLWIDGKGYTTASNDLGSLGYILLETPTVNLEDVDQELEETFPNLHAQVVIFKVKPNIFAVDGGIARIAISVPVQRGGDIEEKCISFTAGNCKGVSVMSNEISFSAELLVMDEAVAENDIVVPDEEVASAAEMAPASEETEAVV
jgi:hypothetical protein